MTCLHIYIHGILKNVTADAFRLLAKVLRGVALFIGGNELGRSVQVSYTAIRKRWSNEGKNL